MVFRHPRQGPERHEEEAVGEREVVHLQAERGADRVVGQVPAVLDHALDPELRDEGVAAVDQGDGQVGPPELQGPREGRQAEDDRDDIHDRRLPGLRHRAPPRRSSLNSRLALNVPARSL